MDLILKGIKSARIYPGRRGQNEKYKEIKSSKWHPLLEKCAVFRVVYNFFWSRMSDLDWNFTPVSNEHSLLAVCEINRLYASETGVTSCVEMFKFFVWKFARFRALFLYKHDNRCKYELHPRIAKETGVNWANEPTFKFPVRTDQSKHKSTSYFVRTFFQFHCCSYDMTWSRLQNFMKTMSILSSLKTIIIKSLPTMSSHIYCLLFTIVKCKLSGNSVYFGL